MEALLKDVRFAVRGLRRNPGFAAVAILTLALGIGANTAIFSVVDAALLRPLPFKDPDRLALVFQSNVKRGWKEAPVSYPVFTDLEAQSRSFAGIAAWVSGSDTRFNLAGEEPEEIQYALASRDFFKVLGVEPALGRAFLPEEDRPGGPRVALISHELWARRFGADSALPGRSIPLDGATTSVVGILPPSFRFVSFPRSADVWLPLSLDPNPGRRYSPGTRYLGVIARLADGAGIEAARAEADTLASRIEAHYAETTSGWGLRLVPLREQVVGDLRLALFVLFGAVGFVLLIACADLANLLLARAAGRQREIAIRTAIGAGRLHLVRQLLIEGVVLSTAGGTLGLLLAMWGVDLVVAAPLSAASPLVPCRILPDQIGPDLAVLAFTFVLSILTGVGFSIVPALQASRPDLTAALRDGGTTATEAPARLSVKSLLAVGEIALSLILLVGAGLMIRSFMRLESVDPGFRAGNVLTAGLWLPRSAYPDAPRMRAFHQQVLDHVRAIPGVTAAGAASVLPLSGSDNATSFFIDGEAPPPPDRKNETHERSVGGEYFASMGIPVIRGRAFTDADDEHSPRVAIVNETMARRYWPGEDPVGKRIALDYETMTYFPDRPPVQNLASGMREIVGVVGDVKHSGLDRSASAEMYMPFAQKPAREMTLVLRASSDPAALAGALRQSIRAVEGNQPVSSVRTMDQVVAESIARPRFSASLLGTFAALALVLAVIGVYGVISVSVAQRTREFGVRVALGAGRGDLLRLVLAKGLALAAAGIALGLLGALMLTGTLSSLLFGIGATDPATFALTGLLLTAAALLACWPPARRAMRIDPIIALRSE